MQLLAGQNAILTGASGGLGVFIAHALAKEGVNLFMIAYPGDGLSSLAEAVSSYGITAISRVLDLRRPNDREEVVARATAELGRVDILLNNAGVEYNGRYHELGQDRIAEVLSVNLEAPMMLTRSILPQMLQRRRGHIVNIASLAGMSGPAYQEPYAASKAGLIAFTCSLRATYRGSGVSASVVCPGFVEVGIYSRLKHKTGCAAPPLLAACPPERVAKAIIRSLRRDLPETIITKYPVRPLLALTALAPTLGAFLTRALGVHDFFRRAVEAETGPGTRF